MRRPPCLMTLLIATCANLACADEGVSFRKDVAPLLLDHCLPCHGPKKAEGSYRVDTFARASGEGDSEIPGFVGMDLDGSEAYRRMASEDESERMPAESKAIPKDQLTLIRKWIEQGADFDGKDDQAPLASIVPPPVHPAAPEAYAHTLPITALAFSEDGKRIFASGYHELTGWSVEGELEARIPNLPQRTLALAVSPDHQWLAAAGGNPGRLGEVRVLRFDSGKLERVLGMTSDVVLDVAFRPDGERLASASADGALRVFRLEDGELLTTLTSHSDWINAVAWSPDGKQLATASRDKTAKVFDADAGELLGSYNGHKSPVLGVAFHKDGAHVFSSGEDRKVHQWAVKDNKKQRDASLGGEVFKLRSLADALLAPSADKTVRRYDQALKEVRKYDGAKDWVLCAVHHPETQQVAAGCFNGEIVVWDAKDGKEKGRWVAAPGR